jgi:hypothetical protein
VTGRSRPNGVVDLLERILSGVPLMEGAACVSDPAMFDEADPGHSNADVRRMEAAARVCRRCPVLAECGAWAASLPASRRPAGVLAGQLPPLPAPVRRPAVAS